jgi:hypothetical protein
VDWGFIPGTKPVASTRTLQAAEKVLVQNEICPELLQGPKPDVHLMGFIGTTKVMP